MRCAKLLPISLAFLMLLWVLVPLPARAADADIVEYVDAYGQVQSVTDPIHVTEYTDSMSTGWYVVDGTITRSGTITVNGDVHLILADGASLTVTGSTNNAGINVSEGNSLTIYGQILGTGALNATAAGGKTADGSAGIGGRYGGTCGTITINGGRITATGGSAITSGGGAGIGSGFVGSNGTIIINGGSITATGGNAGTSGGGAGIGGGRDVSGGTIVISGGIITANGGNSGSVGGGAGIGGGCYASGDSIIITGGTITANGGIGRGNDGGAGIGGGHGGNGGTVIISGGSVKAQGGKTASNIGKGITGASNGTLTNSEGQSIFLTTVTLQDGETPPAACTASAISAGIGNTYYSYGSDDVITDASGKLYLYLPAGSANMAVIAGEPPLKYSGAVTPNTSNGILTPDTEPPAVLSVEPSGQYVPLNSPIVIAFDEEVLDGYGSISISADGVSFSDLPGTWSSGRTIFTSEDTAFSHRTHYTVKITGFKDFNHNTVSPTGITHTFRTTPPVYAITYDYDGGAAAPPNPESYTDESPDIVLTPPTQDGYVFLGWTGTDIAGDPVQSITIPTGSTGDRSYTAHWSKIYHITYDLNDGTAGGLYPESFTAESPGIELAAPTRDGYVFLGWTGTDISGGPVLSLTIPAGSTGDKSYTAQWAKLHSVTYDLNDGTGTVPTESAKIAGTAFMAASTESLTAPRDRMFGGWNTAADGSGDGYAPGDTILMPDHDLTLYAIWVPIPAPTYSAVIHGDSGSDAGQMLPVTISHNGSSATATLVEASLGTGETVIQMPSISSIGTYTVRVPVPALSDLGSPNTLTLHTRAGSVTLPSDMLSNMAGITGDWAEITIGLEDKEALPDRVKAAVGDRPLISLSLSVDGKQTDWRSPGAPVTVRIPYTLTEAELASPDSIIIWYIDGSGKVSAIPSGRYDPLTGTVTFQTTHFSVFAVGYREVRFADVTPDMWFYDAVRFIAARAITEGTGEGCFSPQAPLTRGSFLTLLMRAYEIAPDENPKDNFSDAGSTYYTGYLAAAKRLGIASGIGDNLFAPERAVTREEMFTLLYNALKVTGNLPERSLERSLTLSDFTDAYLIHPWALEPMAHLVEADIISGSDGMLSPISGATRAQMAQLLYNLITS